MCANYETQLQMVQREVLDVSTQLKLVQSAADRYREDLSKETEYRKEMENKWSEKKDEHRKHVERLTAEVSQAEAVMAQVRQAFDATRSSLDSRFNTLAAEHSKVYNSLKE
jgi:Rab GTPase-binding effector protein 1